MVRLDKRTAPAPGMSVQRGPIKQGDGYKFAYCAELTKAQHMEMEMYKWDIFAAREHPGHTCVKCARDTNWVLVRKGDVMLSAACCPCLQQHWMCKPCFQETYFKVV